MRWADPAVVKARLRGIVLVVPRAERKAQQAAVTGGRSISRRRQKGTAAPSPVLPDVVELDSLLLLLADSVCPDEIDSLGDVVADDHDSGNSKTETADAPVPDAVSAAVPEKAREGDATHKEKMMSIVASVFNQVDNAAGSRQSRAKEHGEVFGIFNNSVLSASEVNA
jgi:hypothetical protein